VSEGEGEQREPMVPGDKAQPGADNAGEDLCPRCGGTGRTGGGEECEDCGGAGHVWVPVGTP
jgi:DnaJ-class molecular chaperone